MVFRAINKLYVRYPKLIESADNIHLIYFFSSDIDECAQQGDPYGNHCHLKNTRCVNMNGSYICECLPGYRRIDKFSCAEVDECAAGKATCDEHAHCINTPGSYRCHCKEGYTGNGFDCKRKYAAIHIIYFFFTCTRQPCA